MEGNFFVFLFCSILYFRWQVGFEAVSKESLGASPSNGNNALRSELTLLESEGAVRVRRSRKV